MSNVEFDDERNFNTSAHFVEKNSAIIQKLIDLGIVTDKKSANILLVSIAVVFLVVSLFLFFKVFSNGPGANNDLPEDFLP